MKAPTISRKAVARITDARDWRGTRTGKHPALPAGVTGYADPSVCDGCGAVYTRKSWRRDRRVNHAMLTGAGWVRCPACIRAGTETANGRVVVRGEIAADTLAAIRRRIRNVAARAAHTQPEHRIVSLDRTRDGLEILTSSQQLAHRVVHELKKAFGGRAVYRWSDADNSLYSTWRMPGV
jgi:NMD protein affecting ribosome stability and mRNA decay